MAKDLNKVQLTGYLGADPEMRYTPQGSAVTNFRVASGRTWKDKDGNPHDDTEWFRIVAWDRLGEICNQYLTKGTRVYIEGRLQTRKWTDRDGVDRYTSEVIAQDMIILSSRNDARSGGPAAAGDAEYAQEEPVAYDDDRSSRSPNGEAAVSGRGGSSTSPRAAPRPARRNQPQPIENDDDIPF